FLVDPGNSAVWMRESVVSLDHDHPLGSEPTDVGRSRRQAEPVRGAQAQVLVEVVFVQAGDRWFEDVRGGCGALGFAPPSSVRVVVQRGLGLRASEAELTG